MFEIIAEVNSEVMTAESKTSSKLPQIRVKMLGNFTLTEVDSEEAALTYSDFAPNDNTQTANLSGRSKRLWILIAYLIANRSQGGIPPHKLIDVLWPEAKGDNPLAKLQNNVSRARAMLKEKGFTDAGNLIKCKHGLYSWNSDRDTYIDVDVFENGLKSVNLEDSPDALDRHLDLFELYDGDFLEQLTGESWCLNYSIYYRSLFTKKALCAVKALIDAERFSEVERICLRVLDVEPTAEEFSVYLMQSLTLSGNASKALEHYNKIKHIYEDSYCVAVSSEIETERKTAMRAIYGGSIDAQGILEFLNQDTEENGGFFCNNHAFREIANLRRREMLRSDQPAHILAIGVHGNRTDRDHIARNSKRLENSLVQSLRSGDPFTRIGTEQFLVLLSNATTENSKMVLHRVVSRFRSDHPSSKAELQASIFPLEQFG